MIGGEGVCYRTIKTANHFLTTPCSMLDISLFREDKGGNPDLIRESQRRRFESVELVDEVIAKDKEWRDGMLSYSPPSPANHHEKLTLNFSFSCSPWSIGRCQCRSQQDWQGDRPNHARTFSPPSLTLDLLILIDPLHSKARVTKPLLPSLSNARVKWRSRSPS